MAKLTKKQWKNKIKKQLDKLNIYRPEFEQIINDLSAILVERENVFEEYISEKYIAVISHTNKSGATNITKNPILVMWNELNLTALQYWKELGLTPAAFRKITGSSGNEKNSALAEALLKINNKT